MITLTILGSSAACPGPGGASSAYLVQHGTTTLMVDCGPGSIGNLRQAHDYHAVSAVILSHIHADHILDLIPYRYGLRYGPGATDRRIPLWAPPGGRGSLEVIGRAISGEGQFFEATFEVAEYEPATGLTVGGLTITFQAMQHFVPTWGMRFAAEGTSLVYSADTGPTPALAELAHDTDLLLCEATLPEDCPWAAAPGHLTASEAGAAAQAAGARRLLLTHCWHELGTDALLAAARSTYAGPITIAREGQHHQVRRTTATAATT